MSCDITGIGDKEMHDSMAPLDFSSDTDGRGVTHRLAQPFVDLRSEDEIGNPRFVLDRHEDDAFRRRWALAKEDKARHGDSTPCGSSAFISKKSARQHARTLQPLAEACDRVTFQRDAR